MYAYVRFSETVRCRDTADRYGRERTMPDFDFPPRSDCGVALRVQHVQLCRVADFQKQNTGVQNVRTQTDDFDRWPKAKLSSLTSTNLFASKRRCI